MFMQRINPFVLSLCFIIHLTAASSANAGIRDMLWRYAGSGINDTDLRTAATGSEGNVYAASGNVLYRTADGGGTWTEALSFRSSGNSINAVAVSPDMTDTVYVCTSGGLYKSNDSGAKWQRIFSNIGEMEGNVLSIATGSKGSGVVYIGTGAGLFLTRDSGASWEKGRGLPSDAAVRSIAMDSSGPDILYAALDRWIYKSVNGGKAWYRVYGSGPSAEEDIVSDEEETVEDAETAGRADI
ncbi:MAG: hypothetical protein OEU95_09620, partial [Nitrospirota bacterium]|nr:hypothetical protein [Nitrospirota bacterium]